MFNITSAPRLHLYFATDIANVRDWCYSNNMANQHVC